MRVEFTVPRNPATMREIVAAQSKQTRVSLAVVGIVTLLAGSASLAGGAWTFVGGVATVAGGLLFLGVAATMVRQAVARAPGWYLTGTSRYVVDDDGVTVDDDMCLRFYRWGFFDRAKQTNGYLQLYVQQALHVRVPVAALTPEQLGAVRTQLVTRDILRPRSSPAAEEAVEAH